MIDWAGGAFGPTDGSKPADPLQRGYDATNPKDTLERMRRERDNRRAFRAPEVSPTMTYGTGAGGAPVTAALTGSANVTGQLTATFTVSSELITLVGEARKVVALAGQLQPNGPGSTGKSSPDAASPRGGSTGFNGVP